MRLQRRKTKTHKSIVYKKMPKINSGITHILNHKHNERIANIVIKIINVKH